MSKLALPALMFGLAACTDNTDFETQPRETNENDNVTTFTISLQSQSVNTRSDDILDGDMFVNPYRLSDGSHIDVLVFAVYEKDETTDEYNIAPQFKREDTKKYNNVEPGDGQNVIPMTPDSWPFQIQLTVDPSKTYKVAFWAQNSTSEGYDTKNLEKVEVKYSIDDKNPLNNDEFRDAFCGVSKEFTGNTKETQEVVLKRPLAQVNVGTVGWDYEAAAALKPTAVSFLQSTITLKGVARYYNVISGKADSQTENLTDVTFDFAKIPAFEFYQDAEINNIPYNDISRDEFLKVIRIWDEEDRNYPFNIKKGVFYPYVNWQRYRDFKNAAGEEFSTTVYFNENGDIITKEKKEELEKEGKKVVTRNYPKLLVKKDDKYEWEENTTGESGLTSEKLFKEGKVPLTEIYKYLSMCYVLVPEGTDIEGKTTGSILSSVTFQAKGNEIKTTDGKEEATGKEELSKSFSITNVPVQKNWRTNIIGDNFFIFNQGFHLYIIPDYCGEYDYLYDGSFDESTGKQKDNDEMWNVKLEKDDQGNNDMKVNGKTGVTYDDFKKRFEEYYGPKSKPGHDEENDSNKGNNQ